MEAYYQCLDILWIEILTINFVYSHFLKFGNCEKWKVLPFVFSLISRKKQLIEMFSSRFRGRLRDRAPDPEETRRAVEEGGLDEQSPARRRYSQKRAPGPSDAGQEPPRHSQIVRSSSGMSPAAGTRSVIAT